jgi:PD-(D/E)XK endonuclease
VKLSVCNPCKHQLVEKHGDNANVRNRERLISRRRQGDLGEYSAMEWLSSKGALVWVPLGHSPDVDLIAELDERLLRVQVKTSTYRLRAADRQGRWGVSISTSGGNRSWSGTAKCFDPSLVDYLFVLAGDGRRWFIPATLVEAVRQLSLGGTKYSEYEVERASRSSTSYIWVKPSRNQTEYRGSA